MKMYNKCIQSVCLVQYTHIMYVKLQKFTAPYNKRSKCL